jgi:hypothetical protein
MNIQTYLKLSIKCFLITTLILFALEVFLKDQSLTLMAFLPYAISSLFGIVFGWIYVYLFGSFVMNNRFMASIISSLIALSIILSLGDYWFLHSLSFFISILNIQNLWRDHKIKILDINPKEAQ